LLDYPSNSDDDDSDWLFDDEAVDAPEPDDHVMDPDLVLEELDCQSSPDGNGQEDHGRYSLCLMTYHMEAFYQAYTPEWEKPP
jgi:hypothetical protein